MLGDWVLMANRSNQKDRFLLSRLLIGQSHEHGVNGDAPIKSLRSALVQPKAPLKKRFVSLRHGHTADGVLNFKTIFKDI
jgi:hypothetical protein